jgi:protein TonB
MGELFRLPAASSGAMVRLPASFVIAVAFAGSLFWCLSLLIGVKVDIGERQTATKIEFSRLRRDSDVKTILRQKPEPEKPMQQVAAAPKVAAPGPVSAPSAGPIAIGPGSGLTVDVKGILGGPMAISAGGSDREEMPLVRVDPEYPPRALSRGIEGWALIEFSVTPAGTTKDVKSIQAQPPGIFDQSAVRAVASWKYNPKVEGGTAVERRGMRVLLSFKINKK